MAYKIKNNSLEMKTKDGTNIFGEDFKIEIKEHDTASRSFLAIGSTQNPDRSNDVINQEGWELKNYLKAPRGLWMHDYWQLPIFRSLKTFIDKKEQKLVFRPSFDTHDFADKVYNQYLKDFISDFSVGFIPKDYDLNKEDDYWSGYNFKKQELLEISSVTVPDNPEAQRMGLCDVQVNLIKLGYQNEPNYDSQKGIFWNPITKNLDGYSDPRIIQVTKGVKAVSAIPLFDKSEECMNGEVVGYYFDQNVCDKLFIKTWMKENAPKPKQKFYQVDISFGDETEEKKWANIEVVDGSIDPEEKAMDEIEKAMDKMDQTETPTETPKVELVSETKCEITYFDKDSNQTRKLEFDIEKMEGLEKYFNHIFDKVISDSVKGMVQLFNEMKEQNKVYEQLIDTVNAAQEVLKNSTSPSSDKTEDDDNLFDFELDGSPPVSQDSKDKKNVAESEDGFEVDEEELKNLSNEIVFSGELDESFKESFEKVFNSALLDITGKKQIEIELADDSE